MGTKRVRTWLCGYRPWVSLCDFLNLLPLLLLCFGSPFVFSVSNPFNWPSCVYAPPPLFYRRPPLLIASHVSSCLSGSRLIYVLLLLLLSLTTTNVTVFYRHLTHTGTTIKGSSDILIWLPMRMMMKNRCLYWLVLSIYSVFCILDLVYRLQLLPFLNGVVEKGSFLAANESFPTNYVYSLVMFAMITIY